MGLKVAAESELQCKSTKVAKRQKTRQCTAKQKANRICGKINARHNGNASRNRHDGHIMSYCPVTSRFPRGLPRKIVNNEERACMAVDWFVICIGHSKNTLCIVTRDETRALAWRARDAFVCSQPTLSAHNKASPVE